MPVVPLVVFDGFVILLSGFAVFHVYGVVSYVFVLTYLSSQFLYFILSSLILHVHHHFDFRQISVIGTTSLMVSCRALVILLHSLSNVNWSLMVFRIPNLASFSSTDLQNLNFSQSTFLKLFVSF